MGYSARILKDSLSHQGIRLTTLEVTLPRIILAEFNTHRMLSRNSASSRAIPVEKMLKRVEEDPFIPVYWGKNQKGMQAEQELSEADKLLALCQWIEARDSAVEHTRLLLELGIHKQVTNRLLEPFMWHTVICTATEWENFFALRCSKDAQPEIRVAAELMRDVMASNMPKQLDMGQWHVPLTPELDDVIDRNGVVDWEYWVKVSTARCARISYLTHDGKKNPEEDIRLYDRLLLSGHMSPFEHAARPNEDVVPTFHGNFKGWVQWRKTLPYEDNYANVLRLEP